MLDSLDALSGADVLDLFAGSGALGIECLSRGARSAVLVDNAPEAIAAIHQNLSVVDPGEERVTVLRADALSYAGRAPAFDLVLADPPYGFDRWADLLERLAPRARWLVAETGAEKGGSPWAADGGWETVKVRRYGGTVVRIAQPTVVPDGGR
jgi:16S rRNA (guanine966-N2)-methyltransferase